MLWTRATRLEYPLRTTGVTSQYAKLYGPLCRQRHRYSRFGLKYRRSWPSYILVEPNLAGSRRLWRCLAVNYQLLRWRVPYCDPSVTNSSVSRRWVTEASESRVYIGWSLELSRGPLVAPSFLLPDISFRRQSGSIRQFSLLLWHCERTYGCILRFVLGSNWDARQTIAPEWTFINFIPELAAVVILCSQSLGLDYFQIGQSWQPVLGLVLWLSVVSSMPHSKIRPFPFLSFFSDPVALLIVVDVPAGVVKVVSAIGSWTRCSWCCNIFMSGIVIWVGVGVFVINLFVIVDVFIVFLNSVVMWWLLTLLLLFSLSL